MSIIFEAYRKANKIIDSCDSEEQLESARKYVLLFMNIYAPYLTSTVLKELEDELPEDIYESGNLSTFLSWELAKRLDEKQF